MELLEVLPYALLMVVGLLGVILPLLPGLPIIWGTALLFGLFEGFGGVGWTAMTAITVLTVLGIAASYVIPDRAGAASGASRSTRVLAAVAGLIGFFVIPVLGFPIGACLGVLVAQYRETGDLADARRSTVAVIKGFGAGMLAEIGAGVAMVIVWLVWVAQF